MNRRGFIGTLAAFAGVVLAKIKAPAPPPIRKTATEATVISGDELFLRYTGDFRYGIAGERLYYGDMVVFKDNKIYRYPIDKPAE